MTFSLTIGWWLLPLIITVALIAWALPRRADERNNGSMYGDLGYAVGGLIRLLTAVSLSLFSWLMWALVMWARAL